jgi:hypothetical protein
VLTGLAAALDLDAVGSGVGVTIRIGRREPMIGLSSDHLCAEATLS